jgi:GT2 family glycosyltransferase
MIIIPVYATQELEPIILKSLASVKNVTDRSICYVDDASPVQLDFQPTGGDIVCRNRDNVGYTGAVNMGLKFAMTTRYQVFVVMNDDIFLEDHQLDWVDACGEHMIISPKTIDEGSGDMFGSIWAVHRSVIETIGYLDERLKHYFSDTEYYHRAKKKGITIVKREDIVIDHLGGATYKTREDKNELYDHDQQAYKHLV